QQVHPLVDRYVVDDVGEKGQVDAVGEGAGATGDERLADVDRLHTGPVGQAPLVQGAPGQRRGVGVDVHTHAGGVRSGLEHRRQVEAGTAPDVEHPARPAPADRPGEQVVE